METVPTGLPLDFHEDGVPIFLRGDFIRKPRDLEPESSESSIYDELMLPEHRHLRPEIKFNMIIIGNSQGKYADQAWLGKSKPDTKRGYTFGRVLQGLDPNCRVVLQRWNEVGKISDFVMLTIKPLQLVLVPANYESVLLNSHEDSPARFFEIQAREENRNIESLIKLEGPGYILQYNGQLEPNKNYDELPIPRIQPGLTSFRFLQRRPLYEMLVQFPQGFDFIDPPNDQFFTGAL